MIEKDCVQYSGLWCLHQDNFILFAVEDEKGRLQFKFIKKQ